MPEYICHCTMVDGRVYPDPKQPCPNGHTRGQIVTAALPSVEPVPVGYTDAQVEAVCNAWTVPGQHVDYHLEMRARLERDWPVLANAIKALVAGTSA